MKQEDRIIANLFEEAQKEAPEMSFEQMAQRFLQHAPVVVPETMGINTKIKQLLLQNIGFNSIVLVVGAGLVYYSLRQPNSTPEPSAKSSTTMTEDRLPSASPILPIVPAQPAGTAVASPSPSLLNHAKASQPVTELTQPERVAAASNQSAHRPAMTPPTKEAEIPQDEQIMNTASTDTSSHKKMTAKLGRTEAATPPMSDAPIREQAKTDTATVYKMTTIVLRNTYNQDATREFFTLLTSYGLELKKKKHRFKDGLVRHISMHLTHPKGLDFKLKAWNFQQIAFNLHFDASDQLVGFTIRMNDQPAKEQKIISLHATGTIVQKHRY